MDSKKLFYKIGEVCRLAEVEPHVLRYWEREFPSLAPAKNRAGQRVYRQRDIEVVLTIKRLLYQEGYTIAGARKKLLEELRRAAQGAAAGADGAGAGRVRLGAESAELLLAIRGELERLLALLGNGGTDGPAR